MARVKYIGIVKRKVMWNSMDQCFSYTVHPGCIIEVPDSQLHHLLATGSYKVLNSRVRLTKEQSDEVVDDIKPIIEKESTEVVTESDKKVFAKQKKLRKDKPKPVIVKEEKPVEIVKEEVEEEVEVKEEIVTKEDVDVVVAEENYLQPRIDYTSYKKAELKDMCKDRGLKISGNRDDLITRLCNFDNGIVTDY